MNYESTNNLAYGAVAIPMRTLLRQFSTAKREFKEALKIGPKFSDFVGENMVENSENSPGDGRLPQWLKTPIAVGERYSHLKETLRDLKLHTVTNRLISIQSHTNNF